MASNDNDGSVDLYYVPEQSSGTGAWNSILFSSDNCEAGTYRLCIDAAWTGYQTHFIIDNLVVSSDGATYE